MALTACRARWWRPQEETAAAAAVAVAAALSCLQLSLRLPEARGDLLPAHLHRLPLAATPLACLPSAVPASLCASVSSYPSLQAAQVAARHGAAAAAYAAALQQTQMDMAGSAPSTEGPKAYPRSLREGPGRAGPRERL